MDELLRDRMHEALGVEPPLAGLRSRVINSVPMHGRVAPAPRARTLQWAGQWAAGLVAAVLALALIAALLYSRGILGPLKPTQVGPGPHPGSQVVLESPEGVAIGPDGTVYVSDYLGNRVFRLEPGGKLVSIAGGGAGFDGPATKSNLFSPAGLAVDRDGNLYVADNLGESIRRIDRQGMITTFAAPAQTGAFVIGLGGPIGLALDSAGVLYMSNFQGEVRRFDTTAGPTGRELSLLDTSSLPPPVLFPGYMAFDSAGDLFISDQAPTQPNSQHSVGPGGGCRIVRISPDKRLSVIAGTGTCGYSGDGGAAVAAQLNDPQGIAFDSSGNLYFADSQNHRIRRIDKNGIITTVAGPGIAGQLMIPIGIAMANGDRLYFSDVSNAYVRMLRLSDGVITTVAGGQ